MPNFLMLGRGNRSETMTVKRITRIHKSKANTLNKPIVKAMLFPVIQSSDHIRFNNKRRSNRAAHVPLLGSTDTKLGSRYEQDF